MNNVDLPGSRWELWLSALPFFKTLTRGIYNIHTEKTHVCVLSTQLDKCSHYFILVIWINRSLYTAWCWERWRAGREDDDRGWDGWIASPIPWTWVWANWEIVKDREVWRATVPGVIKSQTRLSGWTTTMAWNSIILMYPWQRKGLRCSYLC